MGAAGIVNVGDVSRVQEFSEAWRCCRGRLGWGTPKNASTGVSGRRGGAPVCDVAADRGWGAELEEAVRGRARAGNCRRHANRQPQCSRSVVRVNCHPGGGLGRLAELDPVPGISSQDSPGPVFPGGVAFDGGLGGVLVLTEG